MVPAEVVPVDVVPAEVAAAVPEAPVAAPVLVEELVPGIGMLPGAPDSVPNMLFEFALFMRFIDIWMASGVIMLRMKSGFESMSLTCGLASVIALRLGLLSIIMLSMFGSWSIWSIICLNIGLFIIVVTVLGSMLRPPMPESPPPAAMPGKAPSAENGFEAADDEAEVPEAAAVLGVDPKDATGAVAGNDVEAGAGAGLALPLGAGFLTKWIVESLSSLSSSAVWSGFRILPLCTSVTRSCSRSVLTDHHF